MKHRSTVLAALALVLLSWNASAQGRGVRGGAEKGAPCYGSVERTRLLSQGVGRTAVKGSGVVYGGVERRAALSGTRVHMPLPQSMQPKPHYPHASSRGRRG